MVKWRLAIAVVAAAIPAVAHAKDREPEVLTRAGTWVVEYDDEACHLYAQFGEGDAMVVARFTRYQPGDSFDFSLYGKRFRSTWVTMDAKIDFGLRGEPASDTVINGTTADLPMVNFGSTRLDGWESRGKTAAPSITPEQEEAVKGVTVAIRGKETFHLEFGSLGKPMTQMRDCSAKLLRHWGYDPQVEANLTRRVTPLNGRWFSFDDYPRDALEAEQSGLVQFRLDVDAKGKVAGCHVLTRTNPDKFASMTCRLIARRAKLRPALDAKGQPVRSLYVGKTIWLVGS